MAEPSAGATIMSPNRGEKRRKLRKGTRSCWECKRRKLKCSLEASADAVCAGCRRRGTKCVTQEFPEEVSTHLDRARQIDGRVLRVESLVEHLLQRVGDERTAHLVKSNGEDVGISSSDTPTPASVESLNSQYEADRSFNTEFAGSNSRVQKLEHTLSGSKEFSSISQRLAASLPVREDIQLLSSLSRGTLAISLNLLHVPYSVLERDADKLLQTMFDMPSPQDHPVLLARCMLRIASFLQQFGQDSHRRVAGLSENPKAMSKRLAETAIGLVATNDEFLGNIEALQCVMLEATYHANDGSLRRSWATNKRAIAIGQLMGFHRQGARPPYKVLDPTTDVDPHFLWFHIVYFDRNLCLMLGLPPGSIDENLASGPGFINDTPMGRLERVHTDVASSILKRNEASMGPQDFEQTQELDITLQKAAATLPSAWWLMPKLDRPNGNPDSLFWETRHLINQLFHYTLLNSLYLPYMLTNRTDRKYDYSKMACVNASREMLSRLITYRSCKDIAFYCRHADFLALMAALTLLLAHLHGHRCPPKENLLAHQRGSDRAMMEQAKEAMEEMSLLNADPVNTQSADLLHRLLIIEAKAAAGHTWSAGCVSVHSKSDGLAQGTEDDSTVHVHVPYFGTIRIASESMVSKEADLPRPHSSRQSKSSSAEHSSNKMLNSEITERETVPASFGLPMVHTVSDAGGFSAVEVDYSTVERTHRVTKLSSTSGESTLHHRVNRSDDAAQFLPQMPNRNSNHAIREPSDPGLTAGVDDWAFQGVDMAIFGNLMKASWDCDTNDIGW